MNLIDEINKEIEEMKVDAVAVAPVEAPPAIKQPKKKRGRPAKVENKIFVEMWNAALDKGSLGEVAATLGISAASCSVKASNMRKAGYDLPQFKRGRPKKVQ
jgi:transposase